METFGTRDDIVNLLVGNKIGKENHDVGRNEGLKFARKHSVLFIEASVKTCDGVLPLRDLLKRSFRLLGCGKVRTR